nr:prolipoprotein diacylglyceryl transferase [Pseudoclavibacter chungangensis]
MPSPPLEWSSFDLGPLTIHTYALIIVAGMIVATIWTDRRLRARGAEPWVVIDIVVWAVILGLLGARLYHVFTHPADYFYEGANPLRIFFIWEGGNAIIGSLIGGAIGAWFGCRAAGIRFWSFADALAPALLLAQAIGRLGNYFNHELFGQPTDLPWGLQIEASNAAYPAGLPEGVLFHPTFLYEMIWNLIGVFVILGLERVVRLRWGRGIAVYFIWYGIGRMWIESLRIDYSEIILGMRTNVFGALCLVILGIVIWIVQTRRHPELEESVLTPKKREELERIAAEQDARNTEATDADDQAIDGGAASETPDDPEPATAAETSDAEAAALRFDERELGEDADAATSDAEGERPAN